MDEHDTQNSIITLLPLAVVLWFSYIVALGVIDNLFYPFPILQPSYYMLNMLNALLVLLLLHWQGVRVYLGRLFVPLIVALLALVPIVVVNLLRPELPPTPAAGPASIQVRQTPLLLLALILTAWHCGWRAVLIYTGGLALIMFAFHMHAYSITHTPFWPPMTVLIIQTISFLVVGYFISTLIRRLQQKQDALAHANARLTAYATTLEELTISRERNRMARELHDTLAHTLSGLSVHLEMMRAYWETDPTAIRPMLDTSLETTRNGLQETRRALKHLRASPLEDLGLLLALRQMATGTAERASIQLDLELPAQVPCLASTVEQCIYRIAQEATANVAHHANASRMALELSLNGTVAVLRVTDDGCGFSPHDAPTTGHYGLTGMHERAELAGGALRVTSQPGRGTTVELHIGL